MLHTAQNHNKSTRNATKPIKINTKHNTKLQLREHCQLRVQCAKPFSKINVDLHINWDY